MMTLEQRALLLLNLRTIARDVGGTGRIAGQAADELEAAWGELDALEPEDGSVAAVKHRADGNAESCKEFTLRLQRIRHAADEALRMPWLIERPGK